MDEATRWHHQEISAAARLGGALLSRRYCVAVAEDDEEMRRLIVEDLERGGHDVIELRDGGELMTYVHAATMAAPPSRRADLLVTDVRMPHCGGLDALELLGMVQWPLPTIVITAFGDRWVHERASELGAASVLDKPFNIGQLRRAVFSALTDLERRYGADDDCHLSQALRHPAAANTEEDS